MKTLLSLNDAPYGSGRTYNGALTADIPPQPEDMARIVRANLRCIAPEPAEA